MSYAKKAIRVGAVVSVLLAGSVLFSGGLAWSAPQASQITVAAPPAGPPITEKELINLIKHNKKQLRTLAPTIESRGIDFEVTPDIEKKLRKAGADDAFIIDIKSYTPSARAANESKGTHVSQAEAQAYNQINAEQDPDAKIQKANEFAQKFPNSPVLTYVYGVEAIAYQQKNDAHNVVVYGEKSLALKPDNLMALLLLAATLPQPQLLQGSDAEKAKQLDSAEDYAKKALTEITKTDKLPTETDKAFQERKSQMTSGAYASLGMVHLERSRLAMQPPDMVELGKAEQNFKTAIQAGKDSDATDYFRLGEIYATEGKLDEAISAFNNAARLAPGTVIEQYSQQHIAALKQQKKSQAKAPAKN